MLLIALLLACSDTTIVTPVQTEWLEITAPPEYAETHKCFVRAVVPYGVDCFPINPNGETQQMN